MKKLARGILTAVIAALLCAAMTINSFAAAEEDNNTNVCTHSYETYEYTQESHPLAGTGTYSITKGILKEADGTEKKVYLVSARGLAASAIGYGDDFISCLQAGFNKNSSYERQCIAFMRATIPENSNVVLAGHSLGGMIMQQIAGNKGVQKRYNILYTVAYGSPKVTDAKPEGTLNRVCIKSDIVPWLSEKTITDYDSQKKDRSVEEVEFSTGIHVTGYRDPDAFKDYDAVGQKNGKVVLTMDNSTTVRRAGTRLDKEVNFEWYAYVQIKGRYKGVAFIF